MFTPAWKFDPFRLLFLLYSDSPRASHAPIPAVLFLFLFLFLALTLSKLWPVITRLYRDLSPTSRTRLNRAPPQSRYQCLNIRSASSRHQLPIALYGTLSVRYNMVICTPRREAG